MFVGRSAQLARLGGLLRHAATTGTPNPGKALLIRGRRRAGRHGWWRSSSSTSTSLTCSLPATGRPVRDELRLFAEEVVASDLPGAAVFDGVELASWDAAFRLLASALPDDGSVVVLDESPI